MDNLEIKRRKKRLFRIIVGTAVVWSAIACAWVFMQQASPALPGRLFAHEWWVIGTVVATIGLFWVALWRKSRETKLGRGFVILKLCSDVLLVSLLAGLFLWNWSSTALIVLGSALAASYLVRLIRSAMGLAARRA